jgi:hypothetical protein
MRLAPAAMDTIPIDLSDLAGGSAESTVALAAGMKSTHG